MITPSSSCLPRLNTPIICCHIWNDGLFPTNVLCTHFVKHWGCYPYKKGPNCKLEASATFHLLICCLLFLHLFFQCLLGQSLLHSLLVWPGGSELQNYSSHLPFFDTILYGFHLSSHVRLILTMTDKCQGSAAVCTPQRARLVDESLASSLCLLSQYIPIDLGKSS